MATPFGPQRPPGHWLSPHHRQPSLPGRCTLPRLDVYANAVYYANWRLYRQETPSTLKYEVISHVFYAFARVQEDGTIRLSDEYADTQMVVDGHAGGLGAFAALKRQHRHLKLILSVGGAGAAGEAFPVVASDAVRRQNFGRSARDLVRHLELDGIDVDWEHPRTPAEGRSYVELLADVRRSLPAPYYILTSALPAGEWVLRNIDLSRAAEYLDYINLMAYDFAGPWMGRTGHHAQLFSPPAPHPAAGASGQAAVEYLMRQGVPASRMLLGVPLYGRSFLGADHVGQGFTGHGGDDGTFDCKHLPRPGSQEHVDVHVGAAYCVGGDGGFVSYDDAQTVRIKAAWAKRTGLGGLFYWTGTADRPGRDSLVEAGFTTLHS